jgi:hypothetical protein
MKHSLLSSIILIFFSSSPLFAEEASQKLPFIGERVFDFYGGSRTGEKLTIKKNGEYIMEGCGAYRCAMSFEDGYLIKGKYSNPLPTEEEDGTKYLIHDKKIYRLKRDGEIEIGCKDDGEPCASELYTND